VQLLLFLAALYPIYASLVRYSCFWSTYLPWCAKTQHSAFPLCNN